MSDPTTTNIGLYQPTHGTDIDSWDQPLNANAGAIDSLFGNVATVSLSGSPVTLTTPPNSGAAWAGPYQSQSAVIKLIGSISTNIVVTIPRSGYYIFWNMCTDSRNNTILAGSQSGSFFVSLSGGAGDVIGLPPGRKCHVLSDGTNMDFVNAADAGTAYDLHGATAMPSWMTACSILPYVLKDGTVYNYSQYPALGSYLNNKFGGNGVTTFAVPDEISRARLGYDPYGTGRLVDVIDGTVMGSAGGDEFLQDHSHDASANVNDPGHSHGAQGHNFMGQGTFQSGTSGGTTYGNPFGTTSSSGTGISVGVSVNSAGGGGGQNIQPSIVSFLPLIKT